jgi:hypothetical protein
MPFLGAVFAVVSSGFAALGITGSMIFSVLLNVGLALIQMLMVKQPKPDDIQQVFRQSTPERIVHAGRVRTGGPLIFLETLENALWLIVYFGQGPVDGYEEWFVDSRSVIMDSDGWIKSKPYDKRNIVRLEWRTGEDRSSVYASLMSAFTSIVDRKWRGDGLATALVYADAVGPSRVAKVYPNRIPLVNVLGRFAKPYDPRTGTYRWTSNLPLLMLYYLTHPDGAGIPMSLIDEDDFAKAATHADSLVNTKSGGTERRYHGSLSWKMTEKPKDVINRLNAAMDGRLFLKSNGKVGFKVGRWEEPTVHIEDIHILMADIADASSPIQEANEIIIRYTNKNANYTPVTSDPWVNQKMLRKSGGAVKNTTLDLFSIDNHNHARRIAKIMDQKLNPAYQGTIVTDITGLMAWTERFITIDYVDLDIQAGIFEVVSIAFDEEELTVEMQIASVESTLYDFDPAIEEGDEPVNPSSLGEDAVPAVTNFTAVTEVEKVNGQRRVNVILSADVPERNTNKEKGDNVNFEFQWSRANRNIWNSIGGIREENTVEIRNLNDGGLYDFRVRLRAGDGSPGEWEVIEDFAAIGDPVAPKIPGNIRAAVISASQVDVTATAPDEPDRFASFRLYRSKTNNSRAGELVATQTGGEGTRFTVSDTKAKPRNTYYYFVASVNFSGVESPRKPARNNPIRMPQ